ncbi:hypothetical protein BKA70DRAFT_1226927 [Coprinopsis sp. MPI-PUGE-AT-0042]|nr:hypothetical protein BKA70DRAFT_1226927 [Coprinopsis sp. MPI-PUGE-AT-0042]
MPGQVFIHPTRAPFALNFIVVGGSISGLATAYSLKQAGHNVLVIEKGDGTFKSVGGLRLCQADLTNLERVIADCKTRGHPPNMTRVLNQWGLAPALQKISQKCNTFKLHNGGCKRRVDGSMIMTESFLIHLLADFLFVQEVEEKKLWVTYTLPKLKPLVDPSFWVAIGWVMGIFTQQILLAGGKEFAVSLVYNDQRPLKEGDEDWNEVFSLGSIFLQKSCLWERLHILCCFLNAYEEIRQPRVSGILQYEIRHQAMLASPAGPAMEGRDAAMRHALAYGDWEHMDEEDIQDEPRWAAEQIEDWWTQWGGYFERENSHRKSMEVPRMVQIQVM